MKIGLLGRKIGMTRLFTKEGKSYPVSVIDVKPNRVSQIKATSTDGYTAIQLTAGQRKPSRVTQPMAGHFAKAKVEPGDMMREFRIENAEEYTLGQEIKITEVFTEGQFVDVSGTSKGKGFAGAVKRHNFRTQDATHGNSLSHRAPGSIGQNQTPGRVFKGKKMAGHLGNERCTIQSLQILKVDEARNLLLVKGGIPGACGSKVEIRPAVKVQERGK